jgi:hypothetical protein
VVPGKIVMPSQTISGIIFVGDTSNEEFIVATRVIYSNDMDSQLRTQVILVWDVGQLETHQVDNQIYRIPRLRMSELLPSTGHQPLKQQGGWLLMLKNVINIENSQHKYWRYILYDIRRGRLAASFAVKEGVQPIMGKTTPNKVQIYYGYTIPIPNVKPKKRSRRRNRICYQYYWHTIEISVCRDVPTSTATPIWHNQIPTPQVMDAVREKHHMIEEHVKARGNWHDKDYLLKTTAAKTCLHLPEHMGPEIQMRHLIDDLFLISRGKSSSYDILLVHSTNQHRVIWSKVVTRIETLIYDEKAILVYKSRSIVQLLDMYTGSVLSSFRVEGSGNIKHIIGTLCCISNGKNVLLDVRTGEKIRTLDANPVANALLGPSARDRIDNLYTTDVSGSVRAEYVDEMHNTIWVDEYAQV